MIPLIANGVARNISTDILGRISHTPVLGTERRHAIRVLTDSVPEPALEGYAAVLSPDLLRSIPRGMPAVTGCPVDHLEMGDVVCLGPTGSVRTLYRRSSRHNSLFATERCDSYCLMCSQPPRDVDDSYRVSQLLTLIDLIDPATEDLGITGGEPTLLGAGLLQVLERCRDRLPRTSLHLLSNGRRFQDAAFARALAEVRHPALMIGIPVYSDLDAQHDYVVQAKGAFSETIQGLHHLAEGNIPIEIRVVIHQHTFGRLPQLAEFIYRNLTFAAHVAFMGLEVIGFAKANIRSIWIDPLDYRDHLEEAVLLLATAGMNVSIYNHQLCTIPPSLWSYSRQSISDWKNEYADECGACRKRDECGGFFVWNLSEQRSRGIRALSESRTDECSSKLA